MGTLTRAWETETAGPEGTRALGAALGRLLPPGAVVALHGELGAGKTTFCAGIGAGLETDEPLRSPTYLLCHEADGRLPVLHLDAYFDARMEGLLLEGLAERFSGAGVLLVEWAERMADWLPQGRLEVVLSPGEAEETRKLVFTARGAAAEELLEALEEAWNSLSGA